MARSPKYSTTSQDKHLQMKKYCSVYSFTKPGNFYSNVARFEHVHKKPVIFKI